MSTLFSSSNSEYLSNNMGIDPNLFAKTLKNNFPNDAHIFNDLMTFFLADEASKSLFGTTPLDGSIIRDKFQDRFISFLKEKGHPSGDLFDFSYELFNYFCSFFQGGLYSLYKFREPHWEGPKVIIRKQLKIDSEINKLGDPINIFRGLSLLEHSSKEYGQSWTSDLKTAQGFAERTQESKLPSGVVKAKINASDVYNYISTDAEFELIIDERNVFDVVLVDNVS